MRERNDEGVRPEAVLAVLIIVSVLLLIFTGPNRDTEEREWGNRLILAVQRGVGGATERVKDGFGSLRRLREMRVQYERALDQLGEYQGLERDLVELRRENQALKAQLGYAAEIEYETIPVRVIAGDPSNLFASITVDKGTYHGIRRGMVVTAFQDGIYGLLGKVETVGTRSCQIRPLVDPDHYVAARLQDSRYEGLVEGRGDESGDLLMRYVRKAAGPSIATNDLVVTSGMNSLYPPGIYIGRVAEVRSREYASSLEIILSPIIDVSRVEYAFILQEAR